MSTTVVIVWIHFRDIANWIIDGLERRCKNSVSEQPWKWMDKVIQCTHVHMANTAAYHEFFHDVEEVDYWMNNIMSNMHLTFSRKKLDGDRGDLSAINSEIKIQFKVGETLTLLNNSDQYIWRVKNTPDQVSVVPAAFLLINGPTGEAIDGALRLRFQLLSLWTTSTKRLGYQMIAFMHIVFRDWTQEEVKGIQSLPKANRDALMRTIKTISSTLEKNWNGFEEFEDLQERISRLRTILDEAKDRKDSETSNNETSAVVVIQVRMLEDLLNHYQEFWTYCESYKAVVEVLLQTKYILVCDKLDELKYTSTAYFVRFLDTNLQMPINGGKTYKTEVTLTLHEKPKPKLVGETIEIKVVDTKKETDDYDEHSFDMKYKLILTSKEDKYIRKQSLTSEERYTFIVTSVTDPRSQDDISVTEAILAGIIDQDAGRYINIVTGEIMSLNEALGKGCIKVTKQDL